MGRITIMQGTRLVKQMLVSNSNEANIQMQSIRNLLDSNHEKLIAMTYMLHDNTELRVYFDEYYDEREENNFNNER